MSKCSKAIGGNNGLTKIVLALSFFLITFSLLIIATNPSNGKYEFSIYSAYPVYFWVSILVPIFLAETLILSTKIINKKVFILSCAVIVFANSILICLPFLRGYAAFGRGDVLTHIGWINDILHTGHIGIHDMYPLNHILAVSFNYICDINIYDVTMIMPVFFSQFLVVSIFLLAREILVTRWQIILSTAIGSLLLFGAAHTSYAPFQQSIFLIPFSLFLFFKCRSQSKAYFYKAIFLFYIIFIVFYHPLSAIFIIVILIVMEQGLAISKRIGIIGEEELKQVARMQKVSNFVVIAVIVFFMWEAYTKVVKSYVWYLINTINDATGSSQLAQYSIIINTNNISIISIIGAAICMYGQYILLIFITGLGVGSIFLAILRRGPKHSPITIMLSIEFTVFIVVSVATSTFAYIVGFGRYLVVSVLFSVFLLPIFLTDTRYLKRVRLSNKKRHIQLIGLMALVSALLITSTLNLYSSPIVRSNNYQVTESELSGMDGFNNFRVPNAPVYELGISQYRMYDALYGRDSKPFVIAETLMLPPAHFGYSSNESWIGNFSREGYLLITDVGEYSYPEIFPDYSAQWRYFETDFFRLSVDYNVTKMFDNGNLRVYQIRQGDGSVSL